MNWQRFTSTKKQMLTLVDRSINELQNFIDRNRPQIAQDQRNREIRQSIDRYAAQV